MPHSPIRRRWRIRLIIVLALGVIACFGTAWYHSRSVPAAETSALQYVRLNGYVSHRSYSTRSFLPSLSSLFFDPSVYIESAPTVGIPRDRMNNAMAHQLLGIRQLDAVILYPPDPDGSGYDSNARSFSVISSFRDVDDLELSEESIAAMERQFPELVIYRAERASVEGASNR